METKADLVQRCIVDVGLLEFDAQRLVDKDATEVGRQLEWWPLRNVRGDLGPAVFVQAVEEQFPPPGRGVVAENGGEGEGTALAAALGEVAGDLALMAGRTPFGVRLELNRAEWTMQPPIGAGYRLIVERRGES